MPIRSLKNKFEQITNGERIGEIESEKELEQREREKKASPSNKSKQEEKTPKNTRIPRKERIEEKDVEENKKGGLFSKKDKKEKEPKDKKSFFQKKEKPSESPEITPKVEQKKEEPRKASEMIGTVKPEFLEDGYLDVLEILNIKPTSKVDVEMSSNDMDYIEFTQTTPLGFSFEEVTDFIARTKYIYKTYETLTKKRDADVQILASEVKKVEKRMMEQNQEKEMEKMIGGMTEEERLIEENLDLKVKVNELTNKLNSPSKEESNLIKELKKKIEILTQENAMLVMSNNGFEQENPVQSLPAIEEKKDTQTKGLPSFDINSTGEPKEKSDFLSDLLQMGSKTNDKDEVDPMDRMIHQMGGEEDYE